MSKTKLLLCILLSVGISACGGGGNNSTTPEPETPTTPELETPTTPEPETPTTPEPETPTTPEPETPTTPEPEIPITTLNIEQIKSLPASTLVYGDNQSITVDYEDNIYITRNELYKQTSNSNETVGALYVFNTKTANWIKGSFPTLYVDHAIYPWGVAHTFAPRITSNKVYVIQQDVICWAEVLSNKFNCEKSDDYAYMLSSLKNLYKKNPNINYYNHNSTEAYDIHPLNNNYWIFGKDNGDISLSTDYGQTFVDIRTYKGDFQESGWERRIRSIKFVLDTPNIVYASGHEGILKSNDSGKSWTILTEIPSEKMAISNDGKYIIALNSFSTESFRYSTDAGKTWKTYDGLKSYAIVASNLNNGIFYSLEKNQIYKIHLK